MHLPDSPKADEIPMVANGAWDKEPSNCYMKHVKSWSSVSSEQLSTVLSQVTLKPGLTWEPST